MIGSGSSGNSYFLTSSTGEILIIELGINWKLIKQALGFDLSKVVGCLVSHSHQDHCKAVAAALADGMDIYVGELAEIHPAHRRIKEMGLQGCCRIGKSFQVMAFPLKHDVPISGFLITHPECGQIVFITDTCYSDFYFPGTNHFIVEANYSQEIIDARVRAGSTNAFLRKRVMRSHMEINSTIGLLRANSMEQVNTIVLIHLSEGNSNAVSFKKDVEQATGKQVYIAEKGLCIPMDLEPF